jgi:pimeloyl-ACP methyl ester carboxylesterase
MSATTSHVLPVPGAKLHYETRGSGPILLMIHGGGGSARAFDGIAAHLAQRFTVVTYDRRGLSRSKQDNPAAEQRVETHSDDARRLLMHLSDEPAYVFGSSGGAVIGLDLAARHPEQVRALIAHEPPSHLLPEHEDRHDVVREIYRCEGPVAALTKFMTMMGVNAGFAEREPDVQLPDRRHHAVENIAFLMEHEFAMYDRYWLDFAALENASAKTRIVLAAGSVQRGHYPYRSAVAVADRLGMQVVEFPGGHGGYMTHPIAFAQRMMEVFNAERGAR